jgi:hypothetical protein
VLSTHPDEATVGGEEFGTDSAIVTPGSMSLLMVAIVDFRAAARVARARSLVCLRLQPGLAPDCSPAGIALKSCPI